MEAEKQYPLTVDAVTRIMDHCLFTEEENQDADIVTRAVIGEGVMHQFGFHPERLEASREEVKAMLAQMPDPFHAHIEGKTYGGGWTFLNACMTRDERHWGEHPDMECLFALGFALGYVTYIAGELLEVLPGKMPFVTITGVLD